MAADKTIEARVSENGQSAYAVDIAVSGYALLGDEPESFGGGGLGPAPFDMLLAALGECSAMTVRWYALQQGWPLEHVAVELNHRKLDRAALGGDDIGRLPTPGATGDRVPAKVDVFEKRVIITGEKLTEEQKRKLYDVAAKCPVQRTLVNGSIIRTVE
jgi:putative redox protein